VTFKPEFFEISAQLIPVLFLAMVVEDKLQPDEKDGARLRVLRSFALVVLAGTEAACLAVIAGAVDGSDGAGKETALGMLLAGLLIVSTVIGREFKASRSRTEEWCHKGVVLALALSAAWLAAVIL
jgi:hypothetical protein